MSVKNIRVAAFALLLASLASCGSSQDAGKEIVIDGTAYNVEVSKLVIGMECDYAPWNWTEANQNEYTLPISNSNGYADGYDIQISKRLSSIMGMEVEIIKQNWDSLIPDLQMDNLNMVIAGMTDTAERRKSIDFTDEYYRSEVVLLASKTVSESYSEQTLDATSLTSLLNGKIIISQVNTVEDDIAGSLATSYSGTHGAAQETYGLAANDVNTGVADFLVVELPVAEAYSKNMNNVGIIHINQTILGVDLSELGVSIGVKKGNDGLKGALNAALKKISQTDRDALMSAAVVRSGN